MVHYTATSRRHQPDQAHEHQMRNITEIKQMVFLQRAVIAINFELWISLESTVHDIYFAISAKLRTHKRHCI